MAQFNRLPERFNIRGIQLTKPVDELDPGKMARLSNVLSAVEGRIDPRPGLVAVSTVPAPAALHTVRRLNDPSNDTFIRIAGDIAGGLRASQTDFSATVVDLLNGAAIGTGYSGKPLSLIPFRPNKSPQPWMYVGDANKMSKVRPDGKAAFMGVAPPTQPPVAVQGAPNYKILEDFSATGPTTWATCGIPDPQPTVTRVKRIDDSAVSITRILYDSGISGWATVSMTQAGMSAIGVGALINILGTNPESDVEVYSVLRNPINSGASSTIGAIAYDSGNTGPCSIVPSVPITDIVQDAMIILNTGAGTEEAVRVTSINKNLDGTISFSCSTVNTHAAGETLIGTPSFRIYFAKQHLVGDHVQAWAYQLTTPTPGKNGSYITISKNPSTATPNCGAPSALLSPALDLTNVNGRQVQVGDLLHISVRISDIPAVLEGIVYFDVSATAAEADFAHNLYYYQFTPADLAGIGQPQQTVQTVLSAAQAKQLALDAKLPQASVETSPGPFNTQPNAQPGSGQTTTGTSQWTELTFKIGQLTRVGNDSSRGLANVGRIGLLFGYTAVETIQLSSFWVGGTYGPDAAGGGPFFYRFRARSEETGARSLPSPATRYSLSPARNAVLITPEYVTDPQVDGSVGGVLAIERFGGSLDTWREIGVVPNNSGGPPAFTDSFDDDIVSADLLSDETTFQPFPIAGLPAIGVANVVGNKVIWQSGTPFNTAWAPGNQIKLGTLYYTVYASPTDANNLEIVENAGDQTAIPFYIHAPIIQGQPLPMLWGPNPQTGELFACGDKINAGRMYFTNVNDPDSADDANWIDATAPNEALMNGVIYRDGINILFSSARIFKIYPVSGPERYVARDVVNSKGLYAKNALIAGAQGIYFRWVDGIYRTDGSSSEPESITDEDIATLFPHGGQEAASVSGYLPPDPAFVDRERLSFDNGFLRWTYVDTHGDTQSWFFDLNLDSQGRPKGGWYPQNYPAVTNTGSATPLSFYEEEGQSLNSLIVPCQDGNIYRVTGTDDAGSAIACNARTGAKNTGDFRADKLWGDINIDVNGDTDQLSIVQLFNNEQITLAAQVVGTIAGERLYELETNSGDGQGARNAQIDFSWSTTTGFPQLFGWECFSSPYPIDVLVLKTIAGTFGLKGWQHIREFYPSLISNAPLNFIVTIDGLDYAYTVPSTGGKHLKPRVAVQAIKGKMTALKLASTTSDEFKLFTDDSEILVGEWNRQGEYARIRPFGPQGP